jgi:LmbE family N-acetylglucosaminyl deacetylase
VNVLAIGAHPDDIELGCAGALLRHVAHGDCVTMLVLSSGERGPQDTVSRVDEQERAAAILGAQLIWGGFHDGAVPNNCETVGMIDDVIHRTGAEVVYTHAPSDTHQDHVAASAVSLAAARKLTRVLLYQSPSTATFEPVVFVDVEPTVDGKLAALAAHASQVRGAQLVDLEAVEAGARFWGHRAKMRYAEAFESPRFVWDIARTARDAARADAWHSSRQTAETLAELRLPISSDLAVSRAILAGVQRKT